MTTKGIVTKIDGDVAYVYLLEDGTCVSCQPAGEGEIKGCAACGLFANNKKHPVKSKVKPGVSVSEGDLVSVSMNPGKALVSSILIFLIPLVLFFAGFALSGIVVGLHDELPKAGAGIGCMAAWYLILYLIGRTRKQQDWPVVEEKVEAAGIIREEGASHSPS